VDRERKKGKEGKEKGNRRKGEEERRVCQSPIGIRQEAGSGKERGI
jgi:hypothetical protein